ncbi:MULTISPECIES: cold-shock protein [unclassified Streptomyces]|uniref:cold-shock protein n=1 Tax=unclassified Streptomyces TaxID=2593676 RepID=UPI0029673D88|nr:cold shock domain-containing protein [Streptomyces sp. SJL17-1]
MQWFDPDRGSGLIRQEGDEPDIPIEQSAVHACRAWPLHPGERVEFDITLDSYGRRADNIHRAWWSDCE